jgi:hypothetical protein
MQGFAFFKSQAGQEYVKLSGILIRRENSPLGIVVDKESKKIVNLKLTSF